MNTRDWYNLSAVTLDDKEYEFKCISWGTVEEILNLLRHQKYKSVSIVRTKI